MALLVYKENPRILCITPPGNLGKISLVIETDSKQNCVVRFGQEKQVGYKPLDPRPIHGCIGIVSVNSETFIGVITEVAHVAVFEGHDIYCIQKVAFYCVSDDKYDRMPTEINQVVDPKLQPSNIPEHPCTQLIKLLSSGSFYFSHTFDLTRNMKSRLTFPNSNVIDGNNSDFVWNKSIMSELLRIKRTELKTEEDMDVTKSGILVPIIQGFVGIEKATVDGQKWSIGIISRLSSNRAGTRFNARGINDDGHVSNFVETEFLIYSGHSWVSFLQVRGSIPLFWEQTGVQVSHKVKITRGPESTIHATHQHFEDLIEAYSEVQVINLLSQSANSPEYELNMRYKQAVQTLTDLAKNIRYHAFDFHAIVKRDQYDKLETLALEIADVFEEFGFVLYDSALDCVVQQQRGIFRTNCLDCLDRTNVVQTLFGKMHLKAWIRQIGANPSGFEQETLDNAFNNLWADNGDWLSKIYAGTGALKSSYTRKGKQTVLGYLDDAAKSVNRFYVSNFQDKTRQEAIELLLTNGPSLKTPGLEKLQLELDIRANQFSKKSQITVYCATYNLNGKLPGKESLQSILFSPKANEAQVAVIGIQEMIQLTPGEYISADTEKLREVWEKALLDEMNKTSKVGYVVLRSLHLVALGLFVFIHKDFTSRIRDVETSSIKTGLMGMAANKGGIGIRMKVDDTYLAFATAHFAAGHNMVDDRNRDYWTISNGLKFKSKKLLDHDKVFWFGDFNYRINGENEEIRYAVQTEMLTALWDRDQLLEQKKNGETFIGFEEGKLQFAPTYKYDNNSIFYDTSEKARIPAWCDRILFRGNGIKLIDYNRGEQMMSDHRPVFAFFNVEVVELDKEKRIQLENELRNKSNNSLATKSTGSVASARANLPPPSTDDNKWWENYAAKDIPLANGPNPFLPLTKSIEIGVKAMAIQKPPTNLMD